MKRGRDLLWDALVEELGEPATKSERGARNAALKELREIGATAEDIHRRCRSYRRMWPHITLTSTALAKHWSILTPPPRKPIPPVTEILRLPVLDEAERLENLRRARELAQSIGKEIA